MVVGDFPLDGKIAIVTGGGSGINLAFVRLALNANAKVLIADLRLLPESQQLLRDPETAGRVAYTKCDVSKWNELDQLPSEVEMAFGQGSVADVWVAGAGVFEPNVSSFFQDNDEEYYKAMRINADHPIKLTRIAMRSCVGANKPGVVLIVASMAGVSGFYGSPLYAATKHAVVGFTKSMAQADQDENIKIVSVLPGIVNTPLWHSEEVAKQYSYSDAMSITPEEVALAMKDLVEQCKYKGGSLLGVTKTNGRNELESQQAAPSQVDDPATRHWVNQCYAPARQIFMQERGAQLK